MDYHIAAEVTAEVLTRFTGNGTQDCPDWGVPLLAGQLSSAVDDPATLRAARAAVVKWVTLHRRGAAPARLYGRGLASLSAGMVHAAAVEPRLAPARDSCRDQLAAWSARQRRPARVLAQDYDLISGMAGVVLALTTMPGCRAEHVQPGVDFLLAGCESSRLAGYMHGDREPNPLLRWNIGRVNHGLGHGVPGVLAALIAALFHVDRHNRTAVVRGIRSISTHLLDAVSTDERGVLGWQRGSGQSPDPRARHAWCYGTPGVSWQLIEAARILEDPAVRAVAERSMSSLCAAWTERHAGAFDPAVERVAWCHGISGILALCTAFDRHTGHAPAATLGLRLRARLSSQLPGLLPLFGANTGVVDGCAGPLALLLTDDRGWMAPLAIR